MTTKIAPARGMVAGNVGACPFPRLFDSSCDGACTSGRGSHRWPSSRGVIRGKGVETVGYTFGTCRVYSSCMAKVRTNIEIDEDLIETIMDRYGVRTKTAAVDLALRHLAGQPMTRKEAMAMRGARAIDEPPVDAPPRQGA
jgi:Arc/MetJ family transcription regulator